MKGKEESEMVCSEFSEMLDNYENLTETELSDLKAHSAECEACREEYRFFKSITSTIAALPCPEPPQHLIEKVNEQLDKMPYTTGRFNIFINSIKNNSYRYATVAACLAVGLVVGLNNKTISERLINKGNNGVISTTTITEQSTETPVAVPEETETPVVKPTPEIKGKDKEKNKPKAVNAKKKVVNKSVVKTQKETKKSSAPVAAVIPEPEVIVTAEPESPATVNYTEPPVIEKDSKGKYTIARGVYYIPEATEAPVVTEEPEAIEDYSLAVGDYQIAIGYYDIPEENMRKQETEEFSEKLIVSVNDVVKVTSHMSELGVINSGRGYQMSVTDFYKLLSVLDAEGISYRYSSGVDTSDVIIFSIVTY